MSEAFIESIILESNQEKKQHKQFKKQIMSNKAELQSKIKSSGTAWALFLFFGAQYAYVGRWKTQILFWLTLGGLGVWYFISLFLISGLVRKYNAKIYAEIEEIDELKHQRQLEKMAAMRG